MKILIAPLNWGLGHATRCVPIIRRELAAGNEVTIAADGYPLQFLRQEFPDLPYFELPSYPIRYSKGRSQVGAMLRFLPKLIRGIKRERRWLAELLRSEKFDKVISDNRFGLHNKEVQSVYITHQVMVKMPKPLRFLEKTGYLLHKNIIEKFDECLIPDYAENGGLSGDLSHKHPLPSNARFIGPLSRFEGMEILPSATHYDNIIILSGVEPQRTIFENEMMEKYRFSDEKTLLIRGLPVESVQIKKLGQLEIRSHADSAELAALLRNCHRIISRPGYSSVMDYETLRVLKKVQFHPTPGQTEQEYLAVYLSQ